MGRFFSLLRVGGTGFSEQNFSLDYFAKRAVSYRHIEGMTGSTSSLRDISRGAFFSKVGQPPPSLVLLGSLHYL